MTLVSRLPFTVQEWVQSQFSLCGTYGRLSNNGTGFSPVLLAPLVSTIPPVLQIHITNLFSRY